MHLWIKVIRMDISDKMVDGGWNAGVAIGGKKQKLFSRNQKIRQFARKKGKNKTTPCNHLAVNLTLERMWLCFTMWSVIGACLFCSCLGAVGKKTSLV